MQHNVRNVHPENVLNAKMRKKQTDFNPSTFLNTCCVEFKHI